MAESKSIFSWGFSNGKSFFSWCFNQGKSFFSWITSLVNRIGGHSQHSRQNQRPVTQGHKQELGNSGVLAVRDEVIDDEDFQKRNNEEIKKLKDEFKVTDEVFERSRKSCKSVQELSNKVKIAKLCGKTLIPIIGELLVAQAEEQYAQNGVKYWEQKLKLGLADPGSRDATLTAILGEASQVRYGDEYLNSKSSKRRFLQINMPN